MSLAQALLDALAVAPRLAQAEIADLLTRARQQHPKEAA
jgi:hypothetical protein